MYLCVICIIFIDPKNNDLFNQIKKTIKNYENFAK